MASLDALIAAKTGKQIEKVVSKLKVEQIHYTKLSASEKNFYSQEGIEDLADNLQMAGMILQPLIVRRTDIGEYEVIAGHRRRLASIKCVEEREDKRFEFLPCVVLKVSEMAAELINNISEDDINQEELAESFVEYLMISTNSTARSDLTAYEKMMQTMRLKELIPRITRDENMRGRALRAEVVKATGYANGTVAAFENIYNNLVPTGLERFKSEDIGFTVANEISGLSEDKQEEVLKLDVITIKDVDAVKGRKTVSESDTETEHTSVSESDTESSEDDAPKILDWRQEDLITDMKLIFRKSDYRPGCFECLMELFQTENEDHTKSAEEYFWTCLPYSSGYVEVSQPEADYEVLFTRSNELLRIPVSEFWKAFMTAFVPTAKEETEEEFEEFEDIESVEESKDYFEHTSVSESDTENEHTLVSDSDTEIYTIKDVKELHTKTLQRHNQLEDEAQKRSESDYLVNLRRTTKINLDALTYLLKKMEGKK